MSTLSNLVSILENYSLSALIKSFEDGTFDIYAPGSSKLVGCDQRSKDARMEGMVHMEGSVHIHTAMVIVASRRIRYEDTVVDYDDTDLLAALLHDIEKPGCRRILSNDRVSFTGHEVKGAQRMLSLALELRLDSAKSRKLCFLVENHGKAHELPKLEENEQRLIVGPPFWRNLRVLQRADAESCWTRPDGSSWMPTYWDMFREMNSQFFGVEGP